MFYGENSFELYELRHTDIIELFVPELQTCNVQIIQELHIHCNDRQHFPLFGRLLGCIAKFTGLRRLLLSDLCNDYRLRSLSTASHGLYFLEQLIADVEELKELEHIRLTFELRVSIASDWLDFRQGLTCLPGWVCETTFAEVTARYSTTVLVTEVLEKSQGR